MSVQAFPSVQQISFLVLFLLAGCTNVVHLEHSQENGQVQRLSQTLAPGSYVATWKSERSKDDVAAQLKALGARLLVVSSDRIILEVGRALSASDLNHVQFAPYQETVLASKVAEATEFQDFTVQDSFKPFRGTPATKSTSCWNPPICYHELKGRVGVVTFFAESVEGLWNENEDWTQQEVEWESARYASELVALARIAPPEANLSFEIYNLGTINVNGEPSSGYSPYSALVDVIPVIQNHFGLPIQIPSWDESVSALYETIIVPASAALNLDTLVVIGVARDRVAPFAEFPQASSWWPHAILGGPFAVTSLSSVTDGRAAFTHELLHTFGALDQVSAHPVGCELTMSSPLNNPMVKRVQQAGAPTVELFGHVNYIVNGNHDGCNFDGILPTTKMKDIMKNVSAATVPHWRPMMSWYTRAQVGWGNTGAVLVNHLNVPLTAEMVTPEPNYLIDGETYFSASQVSEQHGLFKYLSKGIHKIKTPSVYFIEDSEIGDTQWQRKSCDNEVLVDSGPQDIDASGQDCANTPCEGKVIFVDREYEFVSGPRVSQCADTSPPSNAEL